MILGEAFLFSIGQAGGTVSSGEMSALEVGTGEPGRDSGSVHGKVGTEETGRDNGSVHGKAGTGGAKKKFKSVASTLSRTGEVFVAGFSAIASISARKSR